MSDDDDAPPPLSSLPEQLEAARLSKTVQQTKVVAEDEAEGKPLRVASTVVVQQAGAGKAPPALKKGFFDAKPSKPKQPKAASVSSTDSIPLIKGKKDVLSGNKPQIPDFLRVEPDQETKKYEEMKSKLVDVLKPTPDMMQKVQQDSMLMTGFDDPEVMEAVNDIAQNPQNFKKYKDNKKVLAFYSAMGQLMGQKLESMGGAPLAGQAGRA